VPDDLVAVVDRVTEARVAVARLPDGADVDEVLLPLLEGELVVAVLRLDELGVLGDDARVVGVPGEAVETPTSRPLVSAAAASTSAPVVLAGGGTGELPLQPPARH